MLLCSVAVLLTACQTGPSQQEIDATVEARVTRAVETLVPPTATPVPASTSVHGLAMPYEVSIKEVPYRKMPVEEARREFRANGCYECSKVLAVQVSASESGSVPYEQVVESFVISGDFFGPDVLTDAIVVAGGKLSRIVSRSWWGIDYDLLENNGVTLLERKNLSVYHGPRDVSGSVHDWVSEYFKREQLSVIRANQQILIMVLGYRKQGFLINGQSVSKSPQWGSTWEFWVGDFDDDPEAEIGLVDHETPIRVVDFDSDFKHNEEATAAITQATRDFAANLQTDDETDFKALWNEHGPSAAIAALALTTNKDYDSFLTELRQRTSTGQSVYEAVRAIKSGQAD